MQGFLGCALGLFGKNRRIAGLRLAHGSSKLSPFTRELLRASALWSLSNIKKKDKKIEKAEGNFLLGYARLVWVSAQVSIFSMVAS